MKLSIKALAGACALLWGGALLVGGICHQIWPSYADVFLGFGASIYPGYDPDGGWLSVAVGAVYGAADGGLGGVLLAWLYNRIAG